jgi:AcrR family transcriptional regulator
MTTPASPASSERLFTEKGASTRARIVEAAADLVLARGAQGTSLDDIRAATATSKGQLFHYFPGGKTELIAAIGAFQSERVLDAQRPYLDQLDSWESWQGWCDAVLAHYGSQPQWGCPIGALTAELVRADPSHAEALAVHMDRWCAYLEAGLSRMRDQGTLPPDADPRALALSVFAALHGGLALTAVMESLEPLRAALDGALAILRSAGTSQSKHPALRTEPSITA